MGLLRSGAYYTSLQTFRLQETFSGTPKYVKTLLISLKTLTRAFKKSSEREYKIEECESACELLLRYIVLHSLWIANIRRNQKVDTYI